MKIFRALLVDDEEAVRKNVESAFAGAPDIQVITAESLEKGIEAIKEHFFHAAFIDLHLVQDPHKKNVDGKVLLRILADSRPSCRRFLLTSHPDTYRKEFFEMLHPVDPLIHGAIDKHSFRDNVNDVIRKMAQRWLSSAVEVKGASEIHRLLTDKGVSSDRADLTVDEIDYLVSTLMGQEEESKQRTSGDFCIELTPMYGGRSKSVVALGKPRDKAGNEGIWCVIKLSPREDAREEYIRYCKHVRFIVSLHRRVELLAYVESDTIGAMCYSFAGKSPQNVTSLEKLFENQDPRSREHLALGFDPERKEWYNKIGQTDDLGQFFSKSYWLEPNQVLDQVREFAHRIAGRLGGRIQGDEIRFDQGKLTIPRQALGMGKLRARYKSCIIHGDLNAGNLIVSDDGRVIVIDYRHTGTGPAALDFAAVDSSARVFTKEADGNLGQVISALAIERTIWKAVWKPNATESRRPEDDRWPFWAEISSDLMGLVRSNFPDLSADEYAATCLLWALRVFRVPSLSDEARLRLLVWMSSLTEALTEKPAE